MIHKYKLNGYNIVLDTNSGGVHIVDDITYDLLDNVEPPFEEKCPEKVMEKLKKLDEVAYVRFASVYKSFDDIDTFMAELQGLIDDKKD